MKLSTLLPPVVLAGFLAYWLGSVVGAPASRPPVMTVRAPSSVWNMVLLPSTGDASMCGTVAGDDRDAGFEIGLMIGDHSASVVLGLYGPRVGPVPRQLDLRVDNRLIAALGVTPVKPTAQSMADQLTLLRADVSRDMLASGVIATMLTGRVLTVTAQGQHYSLTLADFPAAVHQLIACDRVLRARRRAAGLIDPPIWWRVGADPALRLNS